MRTGNIITKTKKNMWKVCFLVPALVLFTMIVYYPLVNSIKYSFTDWNMSSPSYDVVGFENYKQIFQNTLISAGMKNTAVFTIYTTFIGNFLALGLALILDSRIRAKKFLRAAFYIPCLLSPIVVSAIFSDILQYKGLLNEAFRSMGLQMLVNDWFGNEATAMPLLIILNAWQWMGYGSVIYLAGLQTIPKEYHEAAAIDGAGKVTGFFKITLPLLMPSITIMTFMSITGGLKLFDIPYVLMNGGPNMATETMGTVIYTLAFKYQRFGLATAVSVVFFVIIATISILQVSITKKREVQL